MQIHLLERREPSPVRLAGVPEAPRVREVQLLEGRGQLRHELHDVHFQVGVVNQIQLLEARALREHLKAERRPLLLRDPVHESETQLLRLAQHQQERRLVLPLDEGHVGAVREVGHRQLEAHRDRRERRGGLETLAAHTGHSVELILDPILHLLVRQRLQHGVQVHHP